jgi:hypothetical protein
MKTQPLAALKETLVHPARMTMTAALAFLAAQGLGLAEVYWAPISALIVVQANFETYPQTNHDGNRPDQRELMKTLAASLTVE